jgi:hypothetical protein
MKHVVLSLPMLGLTVSTRAALGFGIGLLVASRIPDARRRAVGLALVTIGAATTIPLAGSILSQIRSGRRTRRMPSGVGRDQRLVGAERYPRKGDDQD